MNSSITDWLKEMSIQESVNKLFEDKRDLDEIIQMLLQYYINLMQRSFHITKEDVNNIDENLFIMIYNSKTSEFRKPKETFKYAEFVDCFLNKSLEVDRSAKLARTSVMFLVRFLQNEPFHDDWCESICCLLLTYHLTPLTTLFAISNVETIDQEELSWNAKGNEVVWVLLQGILQNITVGLKYKNVGSKIAQEFSAAIQNHHKVYDMAKINYMCNFEAFFHYNNNIILQVGIRSLRHQLAKPEVVEDVLRIVYSPRDNNLTIVTMLELLLMSDRAISFHMDAMDLLIFIKLADAKQEVIAPESRLTIYASILTRKIEKLTKKLVHLMSALEENFTVALLKLFNKYESSNVIINSIIKIGIQRIDFLTDITQIIVETIQVDKFIAKAGSQLFRMITSHYELSDQYDVFREFPSTLKVCMAHENIFCCMLDFVIGFGETKMMKIFNDNVFVKTALIATLVEAFYTFNSAYTANRIMMIFRRLYIVFNLDNDDVLNKMFLELYDEFLQAETNTIVESSETISHERVLLKMNIMMESGLLDSLDFFQYSAVTIINTEHLKDTEDLSFCSFARFHTNILQTLWEILIDEEQDEEEQIVPFDLKYATKSALDLIGKLMDFMQRRDLDYLQARNVFTSLMDLLNFFNPIQNETGQKLPKIPKITSQQVKQIIEFAELYVFTLDVNEFERIIDKGEEMHNNIAYQKDILAKLTNLVKSHSKLPNAFMLFKLVRHYRVEGRHQTELEILLNSMLNRREVFHEMIALAIFSFAKHGTDFGIYELFNSSLQKYFDHLKPQQEVSALKIRVCKFVLGHLKDFIILLPEDQDRFQILDYLQIFADGLGTNAWKMLVKSIASDIEDIEEIISKSELEHLKRFMISMNHEN